MFRALVVSVASFSSAVVVAQDELASEQLYMLPPKLLKPFEERPLHETLARSAEPVAAPRPTPASEPVQQLARPKPEVIFVLDTTGIMSDLIQAAKDKIWAIANTLALAEPAPDTGGPSDPKE